MASFAWMLPRMTMAATLLTRPMPLYWRYCFEGMGERPSVYSLFLLSGSESYKDYNISQRPTFSGWAAGNCSELIMLTILYLMWSLHPYAGVDSFILTTGHPTRVFWSGLHSMVRNGMLFKE